MNLTEIINELYECASILQQHSITHKSVYQITNNQKTENELIENIYQNIKLLFNAIHDGQVVKLPITAMIEQKLDNDCKFSHKKKDQYFNGMSAVVYLDKHKWSTPLIDICGDKYYNNEISLLRKQQLEDEEGVIIDK